MKNCSIENCQTKSVKRGYCDKHYRRWWVHGDPNTILIHRHNLESNSKTCPTCSIEKLKKEFYSSKYNKDGLRGQCKTCETSYQLLHADDRRDYHKNWKLLDRYGITLDDWEDLFLSQDHKCAICKTEKHNGINWHTDHCHETGLVRGILCFDCNNVVGKVENGWDVEVPAINNYLKRWEQCRTKSLSRMVNSA